MQQPANDILIIGATGFLGIHITRTLYQHNYNIHALRRESTQTNRLHDISHNITWHQGDLLDITSLEEAITPQTIVIHNGALVTFQRKLRKKLYKVNVEGTANLVNACLEKQCPLLIYVSSIAAIGRTPTGQGDLNEDHQWDGSLKMSHYTKSKFLAELEVWRGINEGLKATIINPSVILGPGPLNSSSGKLIDYVLKEKPWYIDGTINYVDVRDVTEAIHTVIQEPKYGQRYILSGGATTYQQFFAEMAQQLNKKPPHKELKKGTLRKLAALSKLKSKITGGAPEVPDDILSVLGSTITYNPEKAKRELNVNFRHLKETLGYTTQQLRKQKIIQ